MIPVSYQLVSNPSSFNDICGFCRDPLEKETTVAHQNQNGGACHPVHRRCMQAWIRTSETCIHCRAAIDVRSLYQPLTLKEKTVSYTADMLAHPHFKYVPFCLSMLATMYFPDLPSHDQRSSFWQSLPSAFTNLIEATEVASFLAGITVFPCAGTMLAAYHVIEERYKLLGGREMFTGRSRESIEHLTFLQRVGLLDSEQLKFERIADLGMFCLRGGYGYLGTICGAIARISSVPNFDT